jgi:hypothetical protein
LRKWAKEGYKLAPKAVHRTRNAICDACILTDKNGEQHPGFDKKANWGLGGCTVCGCTRAKLWLATAQCPLPQPKWRAMATLQTPIKPVAEPLQTGK